jgi:hypothetical protein
VDPFGTPLTAIVAALVLPLTETVTTAGVLSCGASAMEVESDTFSGPGPPMELEPEEQAATPKFISSRTSSVSFPLLGWAFFMGVVSSREMKTLC